MSTKNTENQPDYHGMTIKAPIQSNDYKDCSDFVIKQISSIIGEAIEKGRNKIVINTNLKLGLPMENINKIAGPFVEAWAVEVFHGILEDKNNKFNLINVEAQERLYKADIILQFKRQRKVESGVTAEIDVKATAEDIDGSGKSPNITSYARIRTAYVEDPDYIFVILSLKHKVYSTRNKDTSLMDGIMEVVKFNAYDLKFISNQDISYNPALGTGQIQIRDIHYVEIVNRTTLEFIYLLDFKYLNSAKRNFDSWKDLAEKNGWIK
ncbi:hypothetical protein [Leptospira meyeri]|uniref:hypothetical protein n=1 Tax=Leptospira meyeri TaxID=29508 RepID=UPI00223D2655|nr:hypothetical protein [Leptospira meyeri]MCW7490936.1 hypothetical protein [Leptospira meyeri]